jgi:hypothetical protein
MELVSSTEPRSGVASTMRGIPLDFEIDKITESPERQIYKLVAEQEPQTIHGLVSFEKLKEHVLMHLIENAPLNN